MFCIRQRSLFSLIFIALTLLFLTTATAQVPVSFSHQGRLIGPDGKPAQGDVELTFTIYNSDQGGEILWQEVHTTDLGDSGFYSLTLGSEDNPLDASLFGGTPTFMGVQVNNNPELTPRIPFNSVPYAAVADRAQSATVADSVSPGSIGPEALANDFTISWSDIEDTPAAIQGLDYTNAPYLFEAQNTPLTAVAFGENRADSSAYNGEVRFVSSSDTADPAGVDGRVWSLHTDSLGHLIATGHTAVIARVKVANNSSTIPIARLVCKASRQGILMELNAADIIPSEFAANQSWRHYLIHCDFQPNDEAQYIGVEDFQTAITDLSIDYVRVEGLPDAPFISSNLLMDGAIRSRHIAHNAVGAAQVADSSIGTSHLANNAVTSAKIASNAVGSSELADNSVTTAKIATNAVGSSELANNAVTSAKIASGAITRSKMVNAIPIYEVTAEGCAYTKGSLSRSNTCFSTLCANGRFTSCNSTTTCSESRVRECPNVLLGYINVAP